MPGLCASFYGNTFIDSDGKMRGILVDENLPKTMILGIECTHATELGRQKTDTELWEYAKKNDLVIVTKDTDFLDRILLLGSPPKVVWIRFGNLKLKEISARLSNIWAEIESYLNEFDLIEVTHSGLNGIKSPPAP